LFGGLFSSSLDIFITEAVDPYICVGVLTSELYFNVSVYTFQESLEELGVTENYDINDVNLIKLHIYKVIILYISQ